MIPPVRTYSYLTSSKFNSNQPANNFPIDRKLNRPRTKQTYRHESNVAYAQSPLNYFKSEDPLLPLIPALNYDRLNPHELTLHSLLSHYHSLLQRLVPRDCKYPSAILFISPTFPSLTRLPAARPTAKPLCFISNVLSFLKRFSGDN